MKLLEIVPQLISIVTVGIIAGFLIRYDLQMNYCPYCSTRKGCSTGHNIKSRCPEQDQIPYFCKQDKRKR